jgi:uncharacterized membrane protein
MLLTIYILDMLLATMLMAVGCWIPAVMLVLVGVGMSVWCFRHAKGRWDGHERRKTDRRQKPAHFPG